jgi:hypothetical protein
LRISQFVVGRCLRVLRIGYGLGCITDLSLIISNRAVLLCNVGLILSNFCVGIVNGFLGFARVAVVQNVLRVLQIVSCGIRYLLLSIGLRLRIITGLLCGIYVSLCFILIILSVSNLLLIISQRLLLIVNSRLRFFNVIWRSLIS